MIYMYLSFRKMNFFKIFIFLGIYYCIFGGDLFGRFGRVEIYFNDNWGMFCNIDWGEDEVVVFCR